MFKMSRPIIAAALFVGMAIILAGYFLGSLEKYKSWDEVRIATATEGGTYYILGQQFARILEKLPNIEKAVSVGSAGSGMNLQRLINAQTKKDSVRTDIAFVFRPALANLSTYDREQVRILSRLYTEEVQIIVRNESGIKRLADLDGKRVYVGREKSGTKIISEAILGTMGVSPAEKVVEGSYLQASQMLVSGLIDAAFFAAGKRSLAAVMALESGNCNILDLSDSVKELKDNIPNLLIETIPANFYKNQTADVLTVGADAYLMSRKDLDDDLVLLILNALFDNIGNLLIAHVMARDIRIERAFEGLPEGIALHPGAEKFKEMEENALLIATGVYNGKYYELGRRIQMILRERGIRARVAHTSGSLENARLLTQRPTLAIIQYDIALAASWGGTDIVYGEGIIPEDILITTVKDIKRIATLHTEKVHIMARRDLFPPDADDRYAIYALKDARVCLGPPQSGSQILATAIFAHHNIELNNPTLLSVPDMIVSILSGAIDVGVFVSHVPSIAARTLLENEEIKLLSIVPKDITGLTGPALRLSKIEPGTYISQSNDNVAVETLETKAILVTIDDLPFDVQMITEAVIEGAAYLNLDPKKMTEELTSIPLHPDADKYYREAGYLPTKPAVNWLRQFWYIMASFAILVTALRGYREFRQKNKADRIREEIYEISLEEDVSDTVFKLLKVKSSIRRTMEKEWQRRGRLDQVRQQNLRKLVEERIEIAQKICARIFIVEINAISRDENQDQTLKKNNFDAIEKRIWMELENYKLTDTQHAFLLGVIQHRREAKQT